MNTESHVVALINDPLPESRAEPHADHPLPDPIMSATERRLMVMMQGIFHLCEMVAPELGGRLAYRLFTTPRRHKVPAWEREIRESGAPLVIPHEGVELDALAWGNASDPLVVLVHGWEGRGTQMGHFVAPLVEAGFRVIAFDGPAHGRSPGNHTSLITFARVFDSIVTQQGAVHGIVGHSFGGAATLLAAQNGLDGARLVIIASPARIMYVMNNYRRLLGFGERVFDAFLARFERLQGMHPRDADLTLLENALCAPGLIVHDRDDTEVTYENGEALHRHWKRAQLLTTRGLRHRRILKNVEVIQAVVAFLRTA